MKERESKVLVIWKKWEDMKKILYQTEVWYKYF